MDGYGNYYSYIKGINQDRKEKQKMCLLICKYYSLTIDSVCLGGSNMDEDRETIRGPMILH